MNTENDPVPISHKNDFSRLEAIIYVFGINKRIWAFVDDCVQEMERNQTTQLCLSSIIDSFGLSSRAWEILDKRSGFQPHSSLDKIATSLGNVTRERVRQIQLNALKKAYPGMHRVLLPLHLLDQEICKNEGVFSNITSINEAIFVYQTLLIDIGWPLPQGREIRQLLLLIRALVHTKLLGIDNHFPHLSYAACRLEPPILKHSKIAEEERLRRQQQAEQERSWTYEQLAEAVLEEAKMPLHYMEIARRAEDLEHRESVHIKGIHNVLLSNPEKFAFVGQGTYGLTSWGLVSVDPYTDIIAEALSIAGKTLPFGNILQAVNSKRIVRSQTVETTLNTNPRFYCSLEGTYGLRAWLPAREKQTLRTPRWQVETLQSYERVERSVERGYDINAIIAKDKP